MHRSLRDAPSRMRNHWDEILRFATSIRSSTHFTSSTFADRFSACAARRATDFLLRRMVLMSPFLGRRRKREEVKPAYSLRPAGSSRAVAPQGALLGSIRSHN